MFDREIQCEKLFQQLFDNANDAIFYHELNGKFVEVNVVACDRLGYTREELLNMSPKDIDTNKARNKIDKEKIMEKFKKQGSLMAETEHRTKDGKVIPIELSSKLVHVGKKEMVLSFARDITLRKKSEELIRLRNQELLEKSREVATAAERTRLARELHDSTSQVLCYLISRLELAKMLMSQNKYDKLNSYLDEMYAQSHAAFDDIREFLVGVNNKESCYADWLGKLKNYVEAFGKRWKVEVTWEGESNSKAISGYKVTQIRRIVQEALANVRKHAEATKVYITITEHNREIIIKVADDGCGFNPLQVADDRYGLKIMQERALEISGSFEVESIRGKGTAVILKCPLSS